MNKKRVFIVVELLIFLILLVVTFFLITNTITKSTGFFVLKTEGPEKCLAEKNIVLYINSYNSEKILDNLEKGFYSPQDIGASVKEVNALIHKLMKMHLKTQSTRQ